MYCSGSVDYPNEPSHLRKYLGPAIDVGHAMTAKLLQYNDKVVYQSMYRPLIIEESVNNTVQQDMVTFRETAEACLGAELTLVVHIVDMLVKCW